MLKNTVYDFCLCTIPTFLRRQVYYDLSSTDRCGIFTPHSCFHRQDQIVIFSSYAMTNALHPLTHQNKLIYSLINKYIVLYFQVNIGHFVNSLNKQSNILAINMLKTTWNTKYIKYKLIQSSRLQFIMLWPTFRCIPKSQDERVEQCATALSSE